MKLLYAIFDLSIFILKILYVGIMIIIFLPLIIIAIIFKK